MKWHLPNNARWYLSGRDADVDVDIANCGLTWAMFFAGYAKHIPFIGTDIRMPEEHKDRHSGPMWKLPAARPYSKLRSHLETYASKWLGDGGYFAAAGGSRIFYSNSPGLQEEMEIRLEADDAV